MNSVGERLRLERLRQGREISEIATQTRINPRYIEAIEADDLHRLPGGFFYRSFVRQYAGALGLDEAEIDQDLETLLGPPEDVYAPLAQRLEPIDVPPMPAANRSESTRQIPVALVFLVLVIIAASLLFSLWQRSRRAPEPVPEPVALQHEPAPPKPAAPEVTRTTAPAAVPAVSTPSPPQAAPTPPLPTTPPAGAIGTVHLVATGDVWVRLTSGGKNLVERTLKSGESRNVDLTEPGTMRVGDAANLEVWWNGKQVGPLGPAGQLRDVNFSAAGARISLPPRPAPPPAVNETNPIGTPETPSQPPKPAATPAPTPVSPVPTAPGQ